MDEFKETAFFGHNRADVHMISQKLRQCNQDIHRIKQDKLYLADIHRTFNPNTKEQAFSSPAHETFSTIDHIWGCKNES